MTISIAVDPELLEAVDALIAAHPDLDRDLVVKEALRLWWDHEVAMDEQFAPPAGPVEPAEAAEHAAWRSIQAATAERLFHHR